MALDLTMTMRDVFHKLNSGIVVVDASYVSQNDVKFTDTNDFLVLLADLCKRSDEGVIIPFTDSSFPTRVSVQHTWNYKQIEVKIDNGTFSASTSVRYSWTIADTIRALEARFIASWLSHLERIGKRKWADNDVVYNFVDWFNGQTDVRIAAVVPPSPIWGKPTLQRVTDKNTFELATGNYRDAHRFLTAIQDTNKGTGVVFTFSKVPATSTTLEAVRVNAMLTDNQNKVTQNVTWQSTDILESTVLILSTFFAQTPLKAFARDTEAYVVADITSVEKVRELLDTERPKQEKSEGSVIRTTYGSPTFEEDIRNWIIMQAEEMGVA